jgi:two-component sensor histidine kinase
MDVVQTHEFALARRRGAWTIIESASYGMAERVQIEVTPSVGRLDLNTAVPLGLAASEGIANAFKHGFPEARHVVLRLAFRAPAGKAEGMAIVCDDGIGPPPHLPAAVRGGGLTLAEALARQVGEQATPMREGAWTVWRLTFQGVAQPMPAS